MSATNKLQKLFDAAVMDLEPDNPTRMVSLPHNPNGSRSASPEDPSLKIEVEHFDPRSEMLARVSRMKEVLSKD